MDTGLRRYDGTESLFVAQIIAKHEFSKEARRTRRFGIKASLFVLGTGGLYGRIHVLRGEMSFSNFALFALLSKN